MRILMSLLFLLFIGYHSYKLIVLLKKMNQGVIMPLTDEDMASIKNSERREIKPPTLSTQKWGIILYAFTLVLATTLFILAIFHDEFNFYLYPFFFIPLLHSNDLFQLFSITNKGILSGNQFIRWEKIKSFEFVPIDVNSRHYGFSSEINDKKELKIKSRFRTISCIVMTEEMEQNLQKVLEENVVRSSYS
ncbi:hypothetical protein [Gracilibacillus dipsosauri]|uniref:hypothetical protein n=1 Tax=Gracilibacillus dipsosauri TaxID=178340 RepID=UPI002409F382